MTKGQDCNPKELIQSTDWEWLTLQDPWLAHRRTLNKLQPLFQNWGRFINAWATPGLQSLFEKPPALQVVKGHNLHGLPYLFVDAPQWIIGDSYCLMRAMCWWGKGFRLSLQTDVEPILTSIQQAMKGLGAQRFLKAWEVDSTQPSFDLHPSPWLWHRNSNAKPTPPDDLIADPKLWHIAHNHPFVKMDFLWPFGSQAADTGLWHKRQRQLCELLTAIAPTDRNE